MQYLSRYRLGVFIETIMNRTHGIILWAEISEVLMTRIEMRKDKSRRSRIKNSSISVKWDNGSEIRINPIDSRVQHTRLKNYIYNKTKQ